MKLHKNQSGSAVIILLVVLVLAVIGFGGYYVWHTQHTKTPTVTTTSSSKTATTTPAIATTPTTATPSQQYLVFTQWNVEIPLSSSISDADYVVASNDPNTIYVSLTSLPASCNADSHLVGSYFRYTAGETDSYSGETYSQELGANAVNAGSYYYVYKGPQAACSDDASVQATVTAAISSFKSALAGLKAVN